MDLKLEQSALEELLRSVEDLFAHLAGFSMSGAVPAPGAKDKERASPESNDITAEQNAITSSATEPKSEAASALAIAAAADGSPNPLPASRPVAPASVRVDNPVPNRKSKRKHKKP